MNPDPDLDHLERVHAPDLDPNFDDDVYDDIPPPYPLAKGYGPLFQYLDTLTTTVERVAAGQFTREAIAVVKNRQFIEFCDRAGDRVTATLYRDVIEPDERFHHELGRSLLLRSATTPTAQDAARFLNVTASWIYEHVRDDAADRLPVVKLGKYLRFDQRDLRDYIDAKRDASRMRRRRR